MESNRNFMKVTGLVGREVALSYTSSGKALAKFSVALSFQRKYKDEEQKATIWLNCVAWEQVADSAKDLGKGARVIIEGYPTFASVSTAGAINMEFTVTSITLATGGHDTMKLPSDWSKEAHAKVVDSKHALDYVDSSGVTQLYDSDFKAWLPAM